MDKEYKIWQIIKWEEKEKYFWNFKYPKEKYDLLNMLIVDKTKPSVFNSPVGILFSKKQEKDFKELEDYDIRTMVVWVKRPNNYKVGDIVKVTIEVIKK